VRFGLALAGVFGLALAVRFAQYLQTHLVFTDSAHYVDMARMLLRGDVASLVAHEYHPLFAVVIAGAFRIFGDDPSTAQLVAVVAGASAVVPIGFLFRGLGGPAIGCLAAAGHALAPYPVRYAAAGNSEALYFPLFFTAVAFGIRALRRLDAASMVACAGASGLAYLVRPEGAGVFLVVFALAVVRGLLALRRGDRAALRPAVAGLVLFAAVGAPYLVLEVRATGSFELTAKKSITRLVGFVTGEGRPTALELTDARPALGPFEQVAELASALVSSLGVPVALLAILGLLAGRRLVRDRAGELGVAAIFAAYVAVLALLVAGYGYVRRRHAAPVSGLMLGWSARGAAVVHAWIAARFARREGASLGGATRVAALGVALLTTVPLLLKGLQPQWGDQLGLRRAGEWLAERAAERGGAPRVITPYKWSDPRIPMYAGVPIEQPTLRSSAELFSYFGGTDPDYLVVLDRQLDRSCADPEGVRGDPRLRLVHREPFGDDSDRSIEIFRYRP